MQGQLRLIDLIDRPKLLTALLDDMVHVLEDQVEDMVCVVMLLSDDRAHLHVGAAPHMPEYYKRALDGVMVARAADGARSRRSRSDR